MRKLIFLCILAVLLACEVFLIHSIWANVDFDETGFLLIVVLIVVVIPMTVVIMFGKTHVSFRLGKRHIGFKRRLVIRPFDTIRRESRYSGKAVAVALHLDISARLSSREEYTPIPQRRGKQLTKVAMFEPGAYASTVAIGGATFSLEFLHLLSVNVRKWLVGDIEIQGFINDEVSDSVEIRAWTSDRNRHWVTPLYYDPESEAALTTALDSLSYDISWGVEFLKPDPLRIASIYWAQSRYNESLSAFSYAMGKAKRNRRKTEILQQAAWVYLDSGQYDLAIDSFKQVQGSTYMNSRRIDPTQISIGLAIAYADKGEYDQSTQILEGAEMKTPQVFLELGNVHAYRGMYDEAIGFYDEAGKESRRALPRPEKQQSAGELTTGELIEQLSFYTLQLYEMKDENREWLSLLLMDLANAHSYKGRCYHIDQHTAEARAEYKNAKAVLALLSEIALEPYESSIYLQLGVTNEDMAMYDEAIEMYDESIKRCEQKLRSEREDITALADLGWALCGKFDCIRKRIYQLPASLEEQKAISLEAIGAENGQDANTMVIINAMAELLQILRQEERQEWLLAVWQAATIPEERSEPEYIAAVSEVAAKFVNIVLEKGEEQEIRRVSQLAHDYERGMDRRRQTEDAILLLLHQAVPARIEDEKLSKFPVPPIASQEARERGVDVKSIYDFVFQAVNIIVLVIEGEYIDNIFSMALMAIKRDEVFRETLRVFKQLGEKGERHHIAESYYGFACVHSILGNIGESIVHLKTAIDITLLLFSVELEYQTGLNDGDIPDGLRQGFNNNGISISKNAAVSIQETDNEWRIDDKDNKRVYNVRRDAGKLNIYDITTPQGARSSGYRNRAKLDADFDKIRDSEEFQELIWGQVNGRN